MATIDPELQARLLELDRELEEGDITRKGYEKRRTLLLAQFLGGVSGPSTGENSDGRRVSALTHQSRPSEGGSSYKDPDRTYSNLDPLHLDDGSSRTGSGRQVSQSLGVFQTGHERPASVLTPSEGFNSYNGSRTQTMSHSDYAFNPAEDPSTILQQQQQQQPPPSALPEETPTQADWDSRRGTLQGYFQDFTGQQRDDQQRESYGGPQRYSSVGEAFSPTAMAPMAQAQDVPGIPVLNRQPPLEPREIPFNVCDPHNPSVQMSTFESIGAVLRHRGRTHPKQAAYWVLDGKGKEVASITWEKLASKAEKVAQVIRDKSNLYRGDRVALVYRDAEIIDFVIALMGCFIAGVVAVPINCVGDYQKLSLLLQNTQAHLALTTENNLKSFQRDIQTNRLKWPSGVEWWKTNEFGSYHPKKKDEATQLNVPDLAYIEFSRAPTGDLRGVVLSHRTIMHQVATLSAVLAATPSASDSFNTNLRDRNGNFIVRQSKNGELILTYLDPREGIGLILGVFLSIYGGHTTVWMESKTPETAGLYAHLITKYAATVLVADYPRLKFSAYNYQQDPMATRQFKKGIEPNFSSVKICLIDTLTVDVEFHEILADRWFKPMHNERSREVVAPMLSLPEHGGMIISVRDWLGGEERMGCPLSPEESDETKDGNGDNNDDRNAVNNFANRKGSGKEARTDLTEILLEKEALKTNEVIVLAMGEEAKRRAGEVGSVRCGAFGYPLADATLAIVNPETSLLCAPYTIGEIWVDSPSLSGGFWALPKYTDTIFHAHPYRYVEGSPTPVLSDLEFLRTGLLGFVVEGKVYVLGLYEDRIRQKVEWVEHGVQETEYRYFFVQHLVGSVMKTTPKIHDCSAFDVFVNGEYLPIILLETFAASTAPTVPGGPPRQLDTPLLDSLSERVMEVLYSDHHLRVYCVMITAPNTLPKVIKNGRADIGNMLCRKEFDNGSLPCVHVKFGVERAVQNLPFGDDPIGGVWSLAASQARQEVLSLQEKQYSGVDHREVVMDDRTSTPLNTFANIQDLLQWRVSRQPGELAFCSIDNRGREGKPISWKKLDSKVAAVAMYLRKKQIQAGDHVLLMYTHSEEFVYAIHACFVLGIVAIPMGPLDQNRLSEDSPAFLSILGDFRVKSILVNNETDQLLKQKPVAQHLKQSAIILKVNVPQIINTAKPPKQTHGCRELGLTMKPAWNQPDYPVLIWVFWTPDQRRTAVQLGHPTLMALCKVQKETCQMTSNKPVLSCVRSTVGIGFIHMCVMGIFLAAPTYIVSPVDFAQNPVSLFMALARYKVKDTYATSQMLDHAVANISGKSFSLHELKNLMISTDGRPRPDIYQKMRVHFGQASLDPTAINTIYSHVLNPMIASRSYMCIEPIELWLDTQALRRGMVMPVDPDTEPFSLSIQDSGMVPVSTQIAIVNPETNLLCYAGEYGEIWVQSEASAQAFYGSRDPLDAERFNGRTVDGDPSVRYMRTGDLGFLHNVSRPIGPAGQQVDMQVLFVLGSIGETFDVNGLNHFPVDIESSVEKCHRNIASGGSAVFQAGGLVVVLVEVLRRNFLASIVPVIVNAVLNAHNIVVDIVAFVARGDFPRSRLGEKQRGKILASWVTRKMRTIAQFGIRDSFGADGAPSEFSGTGVRASGQSFRSGSVRGGSSLKNVETSPAMPDEVGQPIPLPANVELPEDVAEMPGETDNYSIMESPPLRQDPQLQYEGELRTHTDQMPPPTLAVRNTDLLADDHMQYPSLPAEVPGDMDFVRPLSYDSRNEPGANQHAINSHERAKSPPKFGTSPYLNLPAEYGRGSMLTEEERKDFEHETSSAYQQSLLKGSNSSSDGQHEWPPEALLHFGYSPGHYNESER